MLQNAAVLSALETPVVSGGLALLRLIRSQHRSHDEVAHEDINVFRLVGRFAYSDVIGIDWNGDPAH
jgi:hypothetical protein